MEKWCKEVTILCDERKCFDPCLHGSLPAGWSWSRSTPATAVKSSDPGSDSGWRWYPCSLETKARCRWVLLRYFFFSNCESGFRKHLRESEARFDLANSWASWLPTQTLLRNHGIKRLSSPAQAPDVSSSRTVHSGLHRSNYSDEEF